MNFLVGNWLGTCQVIFVDEVLLGDWSGASWGFVLSKFQVGKELDAGQAIFLLKFLNFKYSPYY